MAKNGKKKSNTSSTSSIGNKNRVAVEIKDVKFEGPTDLNGSITTNTTSVNTNTSMSTEPLDDNNNASLKEESRKISTLAASKLEKILRTGNANHI